MPLPRLSGPPPKDSPLFDGWVTALYQRLLALESPAAAGILTSAQATDLTDSGDSSLHYHAADRARVNHTGTQTSSTISDLTAFVQALVGGSSNHATLNNIAWTSSGHTGAASTVAGFNSSGVAEYLTRTGTGTVVALQNSPSFVTPTLGAASATTLAMSGSISLLSGSGGTATLNGFGLGGDWTLSANDGLGVFTTLQGTSIGALTWGGTIQGTRLISTIATGTAPLTVASTTLVSNLNADLLDGLNSATAATASTIAARDSAGRLTAEDFIGANASTDGFAGVSATCDTTATGALRTYGSTTASSFMGFTLANYTAIFSDGAASNGLLIGSVTSDPVVIGTNNTARVTIASGGDITITSTSTEYSGAANRIKGDYSNATRSDRMLFVDRTTNNGSNVGVIPNGTSNVAALTVFSSSAPDNSHFLTMATGAASTVINSTAVGTGTQRALELQIGGTTKLTISTAGNTTAAGTISDQNGNVREINQNSKSAAYTTVLADAGKHIFHPSADTTARTWTIDSNANVAYPIGSAITFVNQISAGVITIAITSDTMRLAGPGTTGSRTLAASGIATALKVATTEWIISGTGLT